MKQVIKSDRFRIVVALVSMPFPQALKRLVLTKFLGYDIHRSARIGLSLIYPEKLFMGPHSRIGNLSLCKGLSLMKIEEFGIVGNLNWITAVPLGAKAFRDEADRMPQLLIGKHAAITNRHLIDCCNSVELGEFSTFAGFHSQIITHAIDLECSAQRSMPVTIGTYCFVGTQVIILPGSKLPNYSVLGAMACLNKSFDDEYGLYVGVPARLVKKLHPEMKYFHRSNGFVV